NRDRLSHDKVNSELEGVIESYELAFRMQTAVPKIMDFKGESPSTLASYGIGSGASDNFGRQCLMARRFAEAGVRFIELGHAGWDTHAARSPRLRRLCRRTDQPTAGLLADRKQAGLLKDRRGRGGGGSARRPRGRGAS